MVTRNIKANTATQVNANLIGVLVHPNTYPPIVTVDDIVVDYTYTKVVVSNGVPSPIAPGYYAGAITDTNNNVYWWPGNTQEIGGQIYYRWALWPTEGSMDDSVWAQNNPVAPGDSLYKIDFTDPENPVITGVVGTVGALFLNLNGGEISTDISFMQITQFDLYNSNFNSTYQVGGDFLLDVQNGYKVGYVISAPSVVTDQNVTFIKGNVESDYQTWTNNNYVSSGYGTRVLYTATDSPAVGDAALFTLNNLDYNVQTIKAIDTTETPVDPDPVDCKLSYSVDGMTWNDWPENMTDANNVISNIPRYMYLKFSQDVVITEE